MKKTQKRNTIGIMILGLSMLAAPSFAQQDYSTMTNEELAAQRGTMRDFSTEDRAAFQSEWKERVNNMTTEERQQAVGRPENAARDGQGNKNRQGQRSGNGSRNQYRQGPMDGSGNQYGGSMGGGGGRGMGGGGGRGGGRR